MTRRAVWSLAGLLLSGCAGVGANVPQCVAPFPAGGIYQLGAGDTILLTVFRADDLSGEFKIDKAGMIAVPLMGPFEAAGYTPSGLAEAVASELIEAGYLANPAVTVTLTEGAPVYVLGEVESNQEVPWFEGMKVIHLLVQSGGFTYRADTDAVKITRDGCWNWAEPETSLKPGDIVEVPERFF